MTTERAASVKPWRYVQACCLWGLFAGLLNHPWWTAVFLLVALGISIDTIRRERSE